MSDARYLSMELEVDIIPDESAIELGISPAAYQGPPGKSPRIGEDGCWEVFDGETGEWISTGVLAGSKISGYDQFVIDGGDAEGI